MNAAGLFFLLLLLLVILPGAGWIGYVRWRAHRSGLPAPPLSAYVPFKRDASSSSSSRRGGGGVAGWISDKIGSLKGGSSRSDGGAGYEGNRTRGFGPLDPDGAWDSRVGYEADATGGGGAYGRVGSYEEQELGLHPGSAAAAGRREEEYEDEGRYGGGGYGGGGRVLHEYGREERGRSRSRDGGPAYASESSRRYGDEENPFSDDNRLRGVSPRPVEMDAGSSQSYGGKKSAGDNMSVKSGGRKSIFQEDM